MLTHGKGSTSTFPIQVLFKGTLNGVQEIVSINAYPRQIFDYTGTQVIYAGYNRDASAASAATDWIVIKREYSAAGYVQQHQILVGSWTGRAGLSWDI